MPEGIAYRISLTSMLMHEDTAMRGSPWSRVIANMLCGDEITRDEWANILHPGIGWGKIVISCWSRS